MTASAPSAAEVVVHEDASTLAGDVASRLLERLEEAQARGEVPQIGLTGGTIADAIHREVARRAEDSSVDWSRVVIWWGDERFVRRVRRSQCPPGSVGPARPAARGGAAAGSGQRPRGARVRRGGLRRGVGCGVLRHHAHRRRRLLRDPDARLSCSACAWRTARLRRWSDSPGAISRSTRAGFVTGMSRQPTTSPGASERLRWKRIPSRRRPPVPRTVTSIWPPYHRASLQNQAAVQWLAAAPSPPASTAAMILASSVGSTCPTA